jgi:hypothetical protein
VRVEHGPRAANSDLVSAQLSGDTRSPDRQLLAEPRQDVRGHDSASLRIRKLDRLDRPAVQKRAASRHLRRSLWLRHGDGSLIPAGQAGSDIGGSPADRPKGPNRTVTSLAGLAADFAARDGFSAGADGHSHQNSWHVEWFGVGGTLDRDQVRRPGAEAGAGPSTDRTTL